MVKKGTRILAGTFLIYGLLVATHLGEFWPFSIYPMFSQAGHPWTRAVVCDVTNMQDSLSWDSHQQSELPGEVFALDQVGINQNDLANFISKNKQWTRQKISGVRKYFKQELDDKEFVVFRADGRLAEDDADSTIISFTPYLYFRQDTTLLNPKLRQN